MNFNNPLIKVPLRWGLIGAPIGLLANLALYWMGKHPALVLPFFDFRIVLFAVFIFLTVKEIRDYSEDGTLYFWQGMIASFVMVTVYAVVVSGALYIFMKLQPSYVTDFVKTGTEQLKNFPPEDIKRIGQEVYDQQLAMMKTITDGFLAWRYFMQCFGISIFISIIISVILRRTPKTQ
jgi:hypothetical protein